MATDPEPPQEICMIGAGLVGAMLALSLQREGFKVTIWERYANMTEIPSLSRSINLVMTKRGLCAADQIEVEKEGTLKLKMREMIRLSIEVEKEGTLKLKMREMIRLSN
jgi:2-polyprenyl-6-methoxyphenol hydroxylase-like FAD-dependent oxidoreductase